MEHLFNTKHYDVTFQWYKTKLHVSNLTNFENTLNDWINENTNTVVHNNM